MRKLILTKFDGKIYSIRGRFALRWNTYSRAFYYATKEELKQAYESGFEIGYHYKIYNDRNQEIGYRFQTAGQLIKDNFNKYLK